MTSNRVLLYLKKYFHCYNRKMSENPSDAEIKKTPMNIKGGDIDKMFIFDKFFLC